LLSDISDLRATIVPKSDQLNTDQLLGGPITITVADVRLGSEDQPISLHYANDGGRPFKPCKTMRKVLIHAWGENGHNWVGKSMTLYADPSVRFGNMDVGGIRISHLTDIPRDIKVSLAATKGKKALHEIKRMDPPAAGATIGQVLAAIAGAHNNETLKNAKALAQQLTAEDDSAKAREAYAAKLAELKAKAATPTTTTEGAST
jgi:hypothetical protein